MAEIVNLNFKADANFGPLIAEVNRAMAVLSKFRNEKLAQPLGLNRKDFERAVLDFRDLVTATGMFTSSMVDVTSSTTKFGKALSAQNLKLKDYAKAYTDFRRTAGGQIRALAEEQVRISQSVVKSMGRDAQGVQRALVFTPTGIDALAHSAKIGAAQTQILNKVLRDGSTSLINWGKNTQWAGRQLTVGLTLPITLFGKTAADAFRKADEALVRLVKVYGGIGGVSSTELAKVRKDVTELSKTLATTYGASFEETLGLAADIAATGAEGNDLLAATAETTRLAILGDVDRQESMKATLALQTAFKLNTQQLTESINLLNAVENQTSTTLQDLVEAIPKAGPVIKGLGGDVGTLALFLTAMREGGINAAEGANALKSGLASLINPTKQAQDKLAGFGININDIVNSNAGDLVGLIFDLQKALDQLDPLQKQQAIEQLFGKYQFARLGALLNNIGREGSQSLQVLDILKASTEDLAATADRELSALTESASGRYKRALEGFKAALAEFGEPFLDIFAGILKAGASVLDLFKNMPGPVKALLTGIAGITAIVGPLIMLTGIMGNFIGYIIKGIAAFRQFRSGAQAFELITTATVAADQVADAYTKSVYNQKQAIDVLSAALERLEMQYRDIANASAGGPPRPPMGPGGAAVGIMPMGPMGPMVPTAGGASGGAVPTSQAYREYIDETTDLKESAIRKRADLEKRLAAMTAEEQEKYLLEGARQAQTKTQRYKLGTGRESSLLMPFAGAGLSAMGLMGDEPTVRGMYREGTGAEEFPFFSSQGAHLDAAEKSRVTAEIEQKLLAEGYDPKKSREAAKRRVASTYVAMPEVLNTKAGDMPDQPKLLTREGLMAVNIAGELVDEEMQKPSKQRRFTSLSAKYKAAKTSVPIVSALPVPERDALERVASASGGIPSAPGATPMGPVVTTSQPTSQELKVQRTKSGQIQVRGAGGKLVSQSTAEAKAAVDKFVESEKAVTSINKQTKQTSRNIRQVAAGAVRFSGVIGGAVGSVGMISSMMLASSGSTNEAAMRASQLAMNIGFAIPAVQMLGSGLRGVGNSLKASTGMVGMLGRGLAFLGTGPGMIAVAAVAALALGIKKLNDMHKEAIAKAKADISVSEEALTAFGGTALSAASKFKTFVESSKALAKDLITKDQAGSIPGLPNPDEIAKVDEQVKKVFADQIKRVKGIDNKEAAIEFGRNLKSTLVAQGVDEKTASTAIASIFKQAGKEEFSIPVLLDIAGITNKEQAEARLKDAAQETFKEISKTLAEGGTVSQALGERFGEQLDLLSASALNQVKTFDDLASVVNWLPEGMKELNFQQLSSTYQGQAFLNILKQSNPELYDAMSRAETLADAIQLAAANAMGLTSSLTGVAAEFDIAAQNAMKVVTNQAFAQSGITEYYNKLIAGEQKAIVKLKEREKQELEAADSAREAIEEKIEKQEKFIDQIKDEADARREILKRQQESASYEKDIARLRGEQRIAMLTGNLAQAAMLGIDIEEKMQDRSVELAEMAIDDKEKREIDLHEKKIELLEKEKKAIKDLTDAQIAEIQKRYSELQKKHNAAIENYKKEMASATAEFSKLFEAAAAGNETAYKELEKLIGPTGNKLAILGESFNAFLSKTMESFSSAFGDSLAAILGPGYRVKDGVIEEAYTEPGPKGRGTRTRYRRVSSIAEMFGLPRPQYRGDTSSAPGVKVDPKTIDNKLNTITTRYGTFKVKRDQDGQYDYVEFSTKDKPGVNYRVEPYGGGTTIDKDRIEAVLNAYGYEPEDIISRYMGGKVQKNYQIKAQRFNGGNATKSAFPYLVGEKGPELFIPNIGGNIVPADRLMNAVRQLTTGGSSSDCVYNINVVVNNAGATGDEIASAIESRMRLAEQRVGYNRTVTV